MTLVSPELFLLRFTLQTEISCIYRDMNEELAWVFLYCSFFPFLFILTLAVDSCSSLFLLWSFTTLPAAQCLSTFPLRFLQNTAFGRLATHSGHCIYLLHSHSLLYHISSYVVCSLWLSLRWWHGQQSRWDHHQHFCAGLYDSKASQVLYWMLFFRLWYCVLRSCFEPRKPRAHERKFMIGANGSVYIIVAKVSPFFTLRLMFSTTWGYG